MRLLILSSRKPPPIEDLEMLEFQFTCILRSFAHIKEIDVVTAAFKNRLLVECYEGANLISGDNKTYHLKMWVYTLRNGPSAGGSIPFRIANAT